MYSCHTYDEFDHVGITVADLDAATAFFVDLGLEVDGRTSPNSLGAQKRPRRAGGRWPISCGARAVRDVDLVWLSHFMA